MSRGRAPGIVGSVLLGLWVGFADLGDPIQLLELGARG